MANQNAIHRALARRARHFLRSGRGNIAAITALLIVPLAVLMGLGTEGGSWYLIQRAEQNAADSAVLAAATNGLANPTSTTYKLEAKSVTEQYGFKDGTDNTTVTPTNGETCPSPLTGTSCFKVAISKNVPLYLLPLIGYNGTSALGNGRAQAVVASAMAGTVNVKISDCIVSLSKDKSGGSNQPYRVDGGSSVNLDQCAVQSNGDAKCAGTGADGNASYYFIAGTNNSPGCDPSSAASSPALDDPYTSVYPRSNIPPNTCNKTGSPTDYWQQSNNYGADPNSKKGTGTLTRTPNTQPSDNLLSGNVPLKSQYCGDVTLAADATLATGGTMLIVNGQLNLNGHTLTGTGVTIIFTSANPPLAINFSPSHSPPTNGTLDISAPTSGNWTGVAIYQDPAMTTGVDWTASGNSLHLHTTGLLYVPNSNVTFAGDVEPSSSGLNCFTIVDSKFHIDGNVTISENQSQCTQAGLTTLPISTLPRVALVQ